MKILEHRALRGGNRYSPHPTMFMLLDLGELEDRPSDEIPGFAQRLVDLLPSLETHRCSVGVRGGFIQRLQRGTWAGHIVEHVALELQCLAGMEVGFGKTLGTSQRGVYRVAYRYRFEPAGLLAGREAVALVQALVHGQAFDVDAVLVALEDLRESGALGPSTRSIVEEAQRRGVPTMRLNEASYVQLGYGCHQRRIQATMTDRTSALGVEIADEKFWTKTLLEQARIPTPSGSNVESLQEAQSAADEIGYPVAVKPEIGNHGRGITARVSDASEIAQAYASAHAVCDSVIVEKTLLGHDFRVLVIHGQMVAAAQRQPAFVVGDGKSSVGELIERVNADPRRGVGHHRVLTEITVDEMTLRLMALGEHTLQSVLPEGQQLYLKSTANLSTGGTARDVTDEVHPDVRRMCERVARIVGLDCMGIDIVAPGLDQPLDGETSGIVEVNAAPGFRMHLEPTQGRARNVAQPFVEMLFPVDANFELPIVAVTGTNGKTTTAKLIAHTLKCGGSAVGFSGTTGVEIDGTPLASGDYSGPAGAHMVLQDPTIEVAVLEVARGGILRRGLGFSDCHVGVLLNIDDDHIGTDGVEDLEELALVKSAVIEAVRDTGVSVLNADDPTVVRMQDRAGGRVVFFSMEDDNAVVRKHLEEGGTAVVVSEGDVVIRSSEPSVHVLPVVEAPITLRAVAAFNTANVLAAVAALHGLGIPADTIRRGITTFHSSATQNPGRMNIIDFVQFKVIVDYGHNTPAVRALGRSLPLIAAGTKIVVAHGTGSRQEASIRELGGTLAEVYDHIIIADIDPRDRAVGETAQLVRSGALEAGFSASSIEIVLDPFEAIDRAFAVVQPGDVIVVQVDEVEPMLKRVMAHFQRLVGTASTNLPVSDSGSADA